ncbi:MAG TPA: glycosyltransferase family 2 protein [Solirubrobacteraceae bacterium]|nr:glycosyltransferase family 2 protein [Solirubrobacteraceae bacterium]
MSSGASGVAVVIVNFNGERLLADCLASLAAQTLAPGEIVVADNGSRDGSLALLREHHPGVRALELGRNHGFAGGANRGVRATSAPWVCVLNSDATPAPEWLAQLMAAPRDERTWALGSVLVSAATGLIESAGDAYSPEGYAYKLLRERPLDNLPDEPYPVFAAPGAAPVFRRRVFDLLGGYEERFFLYYEDVDLAFRAALAGYHALLVPSARVVHQLGATTRSMARLRFYVARNSMSCAVRCLPDLPFGVLLRRWLAELRVNRPRRYAAAEIAGRIAGLAGLPRALRERRAIQARRVATPQEIAALLRVPAALSARRPTSA